MTKELKRFEQWWDAEDDIPNNGPYTPDTPIQFAWAGWQAALAQPEPWEKFCDSNCVWTDHHPDCKLAQPEQEPVATVTSTGADITMSWWHEPALPIGTNLYTTPPQRKPLTDEQVDLFINGRGDEDDEDYVEPTGDGFGLTDADLMRLVRRVEAAHGIKENT